MKIEPGNQWGWSEALMNKANYLLETLVWQKSKDATKRAPRNRPKPFTPPFMQPESGPINNDTIAKDVEEIDAILKKPRE